MILPQFVIFRVYHAQSCVEAIEPVSLMADSEPLAEQMVRRALEVRRMGTYIGAFELVAWSVLRNVKVGLVVGGSVHQMREWFLPALPEPPDSAGTHHLVACTIGIRGTLHPVDTFASMPTFRHYVIGVPLPGRSRTSVDPVSGSAGLRAVCLRMGFAVVETQCAGDCGIDALCYHQGLPRNANELRRVRCELATFMEERAENPVWQDCFCACGESQMNPEDSKASTWCSEPPPSEPTGSVPKGPMLRIRALAKFSLGVDLPIYGFDQKGIYMNEAGSKNVGMLALDGAEEVPLKEYHAGTRSRVSLMTTVVSQQADVDALEHGLPLEIMFKGQTEKVLRKLEVPAASNVSRPQ